jgi:hypothetical protein
MREPGKCIHAKNPAQSQQVALKQSLRYTSRSRSELARSRVGLRKLAPNCPYLSEWLTGGPSIEHLNTSDRARVGQTRTDGIESPQNLSTSKVHQKETIIKERTKTLYKIYRNAGSNTQGFEKKRGSLPSTQ